MNSVEGSVHTTPKPKPKPKPILRYIPNRLGYIPEPSKKIVNDYEKKVEKFHDTHSIFIWAHGCLDSKSRLRDGVDPKPIIFTYGTSTWHDTINYDSLPKWMTLKDNRVDNNEIIKFIKKQELQISPFYSDYDLKIQITLNVPTDKAKYIFFSQAAQKFFEANAPQEIKNLINRDGLNIKLNIKILINFLEKDPGKRYDYYFTHIEDRKSFEYSALIKILQDLLIIYRKTNVYLGTCTSYCDIGEYARNVKEAEERRRREAGGYGGGYALANEGGPGGGYGGQEPGGEYGRGGFRDRNVLREQERYIGSRYIGSKEQARYIMKGVSEYEDMLASGKVFHPNSL